MPSRGCFPRTPAPYSEWLEVICRRGAPLTYRPFFGFSCHCFYSNWVLSPLPKPTVLDHLAGPQAASLALFIPSASS